MRELERVGVYGAAGLPVDDRGTSLAAPGRPRRSGPARPARRGPARTAPRRCAACGWRRVRPRSVSMSSCSSSVVVDAGVGRGPTGRRARSGPAGRSAPRPRRGSRVPKRAAGDGGRGIGRASSRASARGRRAAGRGAVADRLDGSGTDDVRGAVGPGLGDQLAELVVPVGDAGGLDRSSPSSAPSGSLRAPARPRPRRSAASSPVPATGHGRDGSTSS